MRDATHITLVIDRSGSMAAIKTDAEGAINSFVKEQQKLPGEAQLKLVEFDAPGQTDWYHIVHDGDLQSAPDYKLFPRGNTALLDAVGRAISETGRFLAYQDEDLRPNKVVFVIQTDGLENSSHVWNWESVAATIKRQTEQFNWQFVFLGMGQESWDQGTRLGVQNIVLTSGTGAAHIQTHSVMNAYVGEYRSGVVHTMAAAGNLVVDDHGVIRNAKGQRINPVTGKVEDDTDIKA